MSAFLSGLITLIGLMIVCSFMLYGTVNWFIVLFIASIYVAGFAAKKIIEMFK